MRKNYYQMLEIAPIVERNQIKAAAQAKADQINHAFRILNDPHQRQEYDRRLSEEGTIDLNYYELFGIEPTVEQSFIKTAARTKANEIDLAFRVLHDPEQRERYDVFLATTEETSSPSNEQDEQNQKSSHRITKKPYKGAASYSNEKESLLKRLLGEEKMEYLSDFETPSLRDIVIFTGALAFFIYMVSLFF